MSSKILSDGKKLAFDWLRQGQEWTEANTHYKRRNIYNFEQHWKLKIELL
jgi:hypothetical protein